MAVETTIRQGCRRGGAAAPWPGAVLGSESSLIDHTVVSSSTREIPHIG
jgi:hypothetical protein